MSNNNQQFWLQNPKVLINKDNFYKIIPTKQMNKIQVLNTLTRLFIVLFLLIIIFSSNNQYIIIPIIAIIIIILIYFIDKKRYNRFENFNNSIDNESIIPNDNNNNNTKINTICYQPTMENPFMNLTLNDIIMYPDRPEACNLEDLRIQKKLNNFLDNIDNVDDLYNRNSNQRAFYTMPSTTLPNNQKSFAEWLYKTPETCKENQNNCLRYEDIRFSRYNPTIDTFADNSMVNKVLEINN